MSRLKKEILSKLKEYAGKMGKDHLGGDDSPSPKRGGLRDFDGYDNVDYNKDMPMDEDSPESAHPQGSKKLSGRTTVMDMLDVISHKEFGPDYHKLSNSQKKKVLKVAKEQKFITEIPMGDLKQIDTFADKKLNPVDVVLTDKHFFDRLNDPRNKKEISKAELIGFFKRLAKKKKTFLDFLDKYNQVVAVDDRTDINIPFMKQANKVIAKTVMRKKDFKTQNQKVEI